MPVVRCERCVTSAAATAAVVGAVGIPYDFDDISWQFIGCDDCNLLATSVVSLLGSVGSLPVCGSNNDLITPVVVVLLSGSHVTAFFSFDLFFDDFMLDVAILSVVSESDSESDILYTSLPLLVVAVAAIARCG